MIAAVDQGDPDRCRGERARRRQTTETAANDQYMGPIGILHYIAALEKSLLINLPCLILSIRKIMKPSPSVVFLPFSHIGYAADDPRDDRIESSLIESVLTVDAELGDEVAGDLGHDLVCIP